MTPAADSGPSSASSRIEPPDGAPPGFAAILRFGERQRGGTMQVGIAMFVTDKTVHPAELGALVEARGFDSLFVPEHTHIPLSRLTPHPRGPLQEHYKRTLDPFVALTAAAAA